MEEHIACAQKLFGAGSGAKPREVINAPRFAESDSPSNILPAAEDSTKHDEN
ncbi:MAG: hypothetical protein Q7S54_00130 [bacterium]|nr:hypothetical protein [bacterium]